MTVAENIRIPLLYALNKRRRQPLSRGATIRHCSELAESVGLQDKLAQYPGSLTQVEMRKLELARAMAADPKLLIADESMAGLSDSEVGEIVELLLRVNERGVSIIMIEHIMKAILDFSQRLVVVVAGSKIADGDPKAVLSNPEVEKAYLGQ